jgi:membrane fusion protein (multidrug efflux system)
MLPAIGLLAACTAEAEPGPRSEPPLVEAGPPVAHRFVDRVEAVGTARANEQVVLSSAITGRLVRLNFDDGALVRRGQVVAALQQGAEAASVAGAVAAERQAGQQLARVRALSDRGFATKTLLDEQVSLAARTRAAVGEAQARLADRVITAPFSGYASLRTISVGAIVNAGTPIATISDTSRIKLDFSVPETMLAAIRKGQPIAAKAAAYPGQAFAGRITTIDPVIEPSTRAVAVRALLPNPGNRLKPGMLMTVVIEAGSREGLAVPELAVMGEGDKRYVFTVAADGKVARAVVGTGARDAGLIEVTGLKPDQRIVQAGIVKVADGMRVRVRPARARTGA